jgi:coproporphyrinogen III oxidase-like Fe-S oxidoreductase
MLQREFGRETVSRAMEVVRGLAEDDLLSSDGKTVCLTAQGQLLSNDVFQEFLGLKKEKDEMRIGTSA